MKTLSELVGDFREETGISFKQCVRLREMLVAERVDGLEGALAIVSSAPMEADGRMLRAVLEARLREAIEAAKRS